MRTHIQIALLCLGLVVIGCPIEAQKTDKAAAGGFAEILPLLTKQTAAVVRVDVARMDFNAVAKSLGEAAVPEINLAAAMAAQKAGVTAIYVLGYTDDIGEVIAVTAAKGTDLAEVAKLFGVELLEAGKTTTASARDRHSFKRLAMEHRGMLLIAHRAALDAATKIKPADRPDVVSALFASGGAPITVAILLPKLPTRQLLRMLPIDSDLAASVDQVTWISLGLYTPPKPEFLVAIQCENAAAAKDVKALIDATVTFCENMLANMANPNDDDDDDDDDEYSPPRNADDVAIAAGTTALGIVKDLKLQVKGNVVAGKLTDKQTTAAIEKLIPPIIEARSLAKMASSGMNLSNMAKAIAIHRAMNDDNFPPTLEALLEDGGQSELMFVNPRGLGAKPDYVYIFPPNGDATPTHHILVYENYLTWPKQGIYYLRVDFAVHKVETEENFKNLLDSTHSGE